ncbi:hypothetical protein [Pseudoalteromonas ardens]|uniref:hypothetical protein n=1 Tax=Pseudoalteromonas ardens TaxID=3048490 RepID=UPI0024C27C7A|nr:hypothetical protein [Pseudoalteromonas sp. R96]MDK1312761.1 hypothetical protein [Pseudoalteromonas sp. R96]
MGNPLGVVLLIVAVGFVLYGAKCMLLFFTGLWGEKKIIGGSLLKGIVSIVAAFFIFIVITNNSEYFELKHTEPNSVRLKTGG